MCNPRVVAPKLKPIGEEFWYDFPVPEDSYTNTGYQYSYRYKVVEHTTHRCEDGVIREAERVVPVGMRRRVITSILFTPCTYGKVSEITYTFGEWEE